MLQFKVGCNYKEACRTPKYGNKKENYPTIVLQDIQRPDVRQ